MNIKVKKLHEKAKLPRRAHKTDAAFDLFVCGDTTTEGNAITIKFGIAMEIPFGFVGKIYPRSSIYKSCLTLSNSVGIIDSGYRGEIMAKFYAPFRDAKAYKQGERAAQIIIEKLEDYDFVEAKELSESDRGTGGHGSTGK